MKELNIIQVKLHSPKANEAKNNGRTMYKYRSCSDILEAVKKYLDEQKCTLTLTDEMVLIGNRIYVKATATITNEAGESVSASAFAREPEQLAAMNAAQVTGASSSYARKYALNGLLAIDDTDDADDVAAKEMVTKDWRVEVKQAKSLEELQDIKMRHPNLVNNEEFRNALNDRYTEIR